MAKLIEVGDAQGDLCNHFGAVININSIAWARKESGYAPQGLHHTYFVRIHMNDNSEVLIPGTINDCNAFLEILLKASD